MQTETKAVRVDIGTHTRLRQLARGKPMARYLRDLTTAIEAEGEPGTPVLDKLQEISDKMELWFALQRSLDVLTQKVDGALRIVEPAWEWDADAGAWVNRTAHLDPENLPGSELTDDEVRFRQWLDDTLKKRRQAEALGVRPEDLPDGLSDR